MNVEETVWSARAGAARRPIGWWSSFAALTRHGLHQQRRAPLAWGVALGAMGALMAGLWPSISDSVGELIRNYPAGLKQAFGIVSLDTVEQYVDAEMLSLIVPLAVAFLAVRCVTLPTAVAEEKGELETLLSLPLSRRVVGASAVVVAAFVVAATLLMAWAITVLVGAAFGTGMSATVVGRGFFNVWPLAMVAAGVGLLAVGASRGAGRATGIAMGVVVGMYFLDLLGKLAPSVDGLRSASVFRYYGSAIQDGIDPSHVAGLTILALALSAGGAELLERRDVG